MIYVQIADSLAPEELHNHINTALLERAANETIQHIDASLEADVTLVLTGDTQMLEINSQYRGIDSTTDVLSFPAGETDPDSDALYLGDVIISYPRAVIQARKGGHSIESELLLLVVHGMLHLLGYDHADQVEKDSMWAVKAEILDRVGGSDALQSL